MLSRIQSLMPASLNSTVVESGDSLEGIMDDEAVVLVNHQSTSDVPVVMSAIHNKSLVSGRVMWVMDDIFKYTNFGWISYVHGDFFIVQVSYFYNLMNLLHAFKNIYFSTYSIVVL